MESCEMEESIEYQKKSWIALRKSINGLLNKINKSNIQHIIPELFGENLIRGRGLFCRSIMKSQLNSPIFTDVFAALVAVVIAVVNTKFPQIGELLCKRMVLQLQKSNNKSQTLATVKFIAHLVNQQDPCPLGLHYFGATARNTHEGDIDKREDQLTHQISLDDKVDPQIELDIFKPDPNFAENENKYEEIKKSIVGGGDQESSEDAESESEDEDEQLMKIPR
ncbi:pre-mRNA-splicing factor cwc22 [Datura stramonium]|uniref:Pre-mRNA-splicing factor cwc22 n=1 Tax=Datura stramonium TaxID=4076 RepID=A0ABS8S3I7_DATST|nr:pre-mRNA-splicing factor cwc22 [Datura stramonium]